MIYNLKPNDFKLAKSTFLGHFDLSTPVALFTFAFVA